MEEDFINMMMGGLGGNPGGMPTDFMDMMNGGAGPDMFGDLLGGADADLLGDMSEEDLMAMMMGEMPGAGRNGRRSGRNNGPPAFDPMAANMSEEDMLFEMMFGGKPPGSASNRR
jgi:hypothetical protein